MAASGGWRGLLAQRVQHLAHFVQQLFGLAYRILAGLAQFALERLQRALDIAGHRLGILNEILSGLGVGLGCRAGAAGGGMAGKRRRALR